VNFLVDSNVLSEPTKQAPNQRVLAWLAQNDRNLATSPVILGELQYGIDSLAAGRRRTGLQTWFASGVRTLRFFEIDAQTAAQWVQLLVELRRKGRIMPVVDSLIAATARQHGLTVATRNTAHYRYANVKLVNPFETSPGGR